MVNRLPPSSPDSEDALVAETERLLGQGEPLLAYNTASTGLQRWPDHLRLRQLQALSLARSGDIERANRLLTELAQEGLDDAETLGVLARTHKDLGLRAQDALRRETHLKSSYRLYAQAYSQSLQRGARGGAYYTGINAAAVAVLRGEIDEARWIAADVHRICHEAGDSRSVSEYWRQATLGEAALILGDAPAAARHYAQAMALAQGRYGDLSTTRRQARLLAEHLAIDDAWLANALHIPPVLVFTGHMVDQPGRPTPRFPASLEPAVAGKIRAAVASIRPLAAYGSAACGADILCLECVREVGGEIHIVLPFPPEEFRRSSVESGGAEHWGPRFDRLLGAAHSLTITSDHRASGSVATFEYANLVLTGLGQLRAQLLDTSLHGLAVWDRGSGGARGGSASVVSAWKRCGIPTEHVSLADLRAVAGLPTARGGEPQVAVASPPSRADHEIKALLFADAVGYSQLSEDQIPRYVNGFLGAVAELNQRTRHKYEHVETAGDGLYMVFTDTLDAARYALELSELVTSTDWTGHGLPASFNMRIALHCGPVYCGWDPVTGSRLFTGPHTSRAARIEPITPPGQVYASSAFAAVAAAKGVDGIVMRYVGRTPLAKRSGSLSLYHLQPAR
jgi:class 3 adenylate cyclase